MHEDSIKGLEPKLLWQRFYEISQIPRPSKKEEKILSYLKKFCEENSLEFKEDSVGNLLINVPASSGKESAPAVVLQAHVDMVCEKNKGTNHDFENDPIKLLRKDGWITADGTTLGSDNGIGVAAALAVACDESAVHGPLEILLTVDEETGLTGANNLQPGFVKAEYLINMDSEEDGAFYIGCSGGIDTVAEFNIDFDNSEIQNVYEITVSGLKGGHSGLDIHTGRGNAIKILARVLNALHDLDLNLLHIEGGNLRNAIPREASAKISSSSNLNEAEKIIKEVESQIQNELRNSDPGLTIKIENSEPSQSKVFSKSFTNKIINALLSLQNGVIAMSQDIPDLVETSTNLATIKTENNKIRIGTSQRSSIESSKKYIAASIRSAFELADGNVKTGDGYPGWKPNLDSEILKISRSVYKELFNEEAEIKAIHAGLECGILGDRNPGIDMVSFGPTIQGAHSPDEKVEIKTVEKFYTLLKGILKKMAERKN